MLDNSERLNLLFSYDVRLLYVDLKWLFSRVLLKELDV